MNAVAQSTFGWLVRREYWEERRGLLWPQAIVAAIVILLGIFGILVAESSRIRVGYVTSGTIHGGNMSQALQSALAGNPAGVASVLAAMMRTFGDFAAVVLSFQLFFYLLGSLYNDRRDHSILFWKSWPVSDAATVLSKIIMAVLVMPLAAVMIVLAGYIGEQIIASIWFAAHGLNPFTLLWAQASPWATWLHMLATLPINAVWALPTLGWLLFWSAAVRSRPLLWASFIPVIAGLLNTWIALVGLPHAGVKFLWGLIGRILLGIVPAGWLWIKPDNPVGIAGRSGYFTSADHYLGTYGSMYATLLRPGVWIGAVVGVALIAAAIGLRRWRYEI